MTTLQVMATVPRMEPPHVIEWDVLANPSLPEWFNRLRAQGWLREQDVPGAKTATGTIAYAFRRPEASQRKGA